MIIQLLKLLKEKRMKDKMTLNILYEDVDEARFENILIIITSKEECDTLQMAYKCTDRVKQVRLQTLRGELKLMKMKDFEEVSDYIMRVQIVVNQLKRNEERLIKTRIVKKILRRLCKPRWFSRRRRCMPNWDKDTTRDKGNEKWASRARTYKDEKEAKVIKETNPM
jgi:gag-polypeptide of LTR copia-type